MSLSSKAAYAGRCVERTPAVNGDGFGHRGEGAEIGVEITYGRVSSIPSRARCAAGLGSKASGVKMRLCVVTVCTPRALERGTVLVIAVPASFRLRRGPA